jgi:hypothetical protein
MGLFMLEPIQAKIINRKKPGDANATVIEYGHLCADTEAELVAYAVSIGLLQTSIQDSGTTRPRFDITGAPLQAALNDVNVEKLTVDDFAKRRFPEFQPK